MFRMWSPGHLVGEADVGLQRLGHGRALEDHDGEQQDWHGPGQQLPEGEAHQPRQCGTPRGPIGSLADGPAGLPTHCTALAGLALNMIATKDSG